MNFKFFNYALITISLSISCLITTNAFASLIDTNDNSFVDTATNLEWMDFGVNNIHTFNYVASQLDEGEVYEGWRLATIGETLTLWENAFFGFKNSEIKNSRYTYLASRATNYSINGSWTSDFDSNFEVMGYNSSGDSSEGYYESATGWFKDDLGFLKPIRFSNYQNGYFDFIDVNGRFYTTQYDYIYNYESRDYSTMLIKNNNSVVVSEPQSFFLCLLMFFGFILWQRGHKMIIED